MKIALVILHADPARGGAERYTVDLATALAKRGHEVSLLFSGVMPQKSVTHFRPGIPYREVVLQAGGLTRTQRYNKFLRSLEWHFAEQEEYNIVHAMLPVRRCDLYHPHAGIAAEALKRWSIHFNPRRRAMAAVERQMLESPTAPVLLCLSDYIKSFVLRHYPLPPQRLVKLFNAVDLERFDPATAPDARQQVRARFSLAPDAIMGLMIAQRFARKGLREAIESLARIDDQRLVLLVVGKEKPAPYAKLAAERGVKNRVIFAGATTDPRSFYAAADYFVLPTPHDSCSLVVLEALAMGVPVISTIFNGACEIMTQGVHGSILKDPRDVDALANAMREMLDPDRRAAISKACLALRPQLSFEHHVEQLLEIYQSRMVRR